MRSSSRVLARLVGLSLAALSLAAPSAFGERRPQNDDERAAMVMRVQETLETRPSGKSLRWVTEGGHSMFLTPTRTWRSVTGHFCRVLEVKLFSTGPEPAVSSRVHCRSEDGVWRPRRN